MDNNGNIKCKYCGKNLSRIILKSDGISALEVGDWCSKHGVIIRHKRPILQVLWTQFKLFWNLTFKDSHIVRSK